MGGKTATAIATGGASTLLGGGSTSDKLKSVATGGLLGSGGDKGGGGSSNAIGAVDRFITPELFKPYQDLMPDEYHGNKPIQDPTAILNAYMQHLPEFLNASHSVKA